MTAGIVSYQLCNRAFECDACPLDSAMRMQIFRTKESSGEQPGVSFPATRDTYVYTKGHMWLSQVEPHVAILGIEPGLAASLIAPKAVVFPSVGQEVACRDSLCWLVVDGTTLQLHSPVECEIQSINTELLDHPQEICEHPLSSGWLLRIMTGDNPASCSPLLPRSEIQHFYDRDIASFRKLLTEEVHHATLDGLMLQDGGTPLSSIPVGMRSRRYYELLRTSFHL